MNLAEREKYIAELNKIVEKFRLSKFKKFLKYPLWTAKTSIASRILHNLLSDRIPINSKVKLFFDEEMYLTYPPHYDIKFYSAYVGEECEIRATKFLIKNLSEGDVFFDIGANQGYYSILSSKLVGNEGKVVAFEPDPNAFEMLLKNKRDNMIILNYAVSNENGIAELYSFSSLSTLSTLLRDCSTLVKKEHKFKPIKFTVKSTTLDSFCLNFKLFPTFMKVDVEGAESLVLKGAETILVKHDPIVILEIWIDYFDTFHKDAVKFMTKLGYKTYVINERGTLEPVYDLAKYLGELLKKYNAIGEELHVENLVFVKS